MSPTARLLLTLLLAALDHYPYSRLIAQGPLLLQLALLPFVGLHLPQA